MQFSVIILDPNTSIYPTLHPQWLLLQRKEAGTVIFNGYFIQAFEVQGYETNN